ncbi:hypothetical protein KQH50_00885 [bacterium]|nr:hypothetical protein [bacterium]
MQIVSILSFLIIAITAMVILVFRDWRAVAAALVLQYLAAFALITRSWPIGMSVVKLIVGWMSTAAIFLTYFRREKTPAYTDTTASFVFRGLAGLLVILVVFIITPGLQSNVFPQLNLIVLQSGLMLMGLALMQLGTNSDAYLTIVSLLSLISGFEVIYAGLELSTLLTGLLAIVNLGITLVGVYFIVRMDELNTDETPEEEPK